VSASESAERPDAQLVRAAAGGDREAFASLYRRYHTVVYRFARTMSGSSSLAEDVTQEVFVTLMRQLPRYQPDRAGLPTYLYSIARNVTRNRLRQDRRFVQLDVIGEAVQEPAAGTDVERELETEQALARLRHVISTLPSRYREIVILCELHGLSYADAALVIGSPIGTVRSRLNRARRLMAERLQPGECSLDSTSCQPIERCLA
jgi:RNA polymerase sigma-70 factor (ECF subfamily)